MTGYQANHGLVGGGYGQSGGRMNAAGPGGSSVLRSINDILRDDRDALLTGSRSRSVSASGAHGLYADSYASPTRRGYLYGSHSRGASPARTNSYGLPSEEERSMERLASTFRTEDYTSSLYERLHDFSPLASDPELGLGSDGYGGPPAAMPLLPDMPSRSRKLLEDLSGSATGDAPAMHIQSRGKYGAGGHHHGHHSHHHQHGSRYLAPR